MALSGGHTGTATSLFSLRVAWSARQNNTDIENNRSYVTATVSLVIATGGSISASASKSGSLTLNGVTTNFTKAPGSLGAGTHTLFTHSQYVDHNSDGSKSFSISASYALNVTITGYGYIGTLSTGSKSYTLDSIPRASSMVLSGGTNTGVERTVTVTRAVAAFRHDLWYKVGSGSWVQFGWKSENKTVFNFTVPHSAIPNKESDTVTVHLQTYSGNNNTKIGAEVEIPYTASVPAGIKPATPSISLAENVGAVSALALGTNRYVQNKSRILATISNDIPGEGATIKSYSIVIGNQTLSAKTGLTNVLNQPGSISVTATVTDSRNRSTSYDTTITVLSYQAPQLSALDISRATSSGVVNPEGTYARFMFNLTAPSIHNSAGIEKNILRYKIDTRVAGGHSWTNKIATTTITATELGFNATVNRTSNTFAVAQDYDVRITLTDIFGDLVLTGEVFYIPVAGVNFFIGSGGVASSFNKFPTYGNTYAVEIGEKGMRNDGPYIDKEGNEIFGASDWVVEQGSNYTKWNSGKLECWGINYSHVLAANTREYSTVNFPVSFVANTNLENTAVYLSINTAAPDLRKAGYANLTPTSMRIYMHSDTSVALIIPWKVVGKWK